MDRLHEWQSCDILILCFEGTSNTNEASPYGLNRACKLKLLVLLKGKWCTKASAD